MSNNMNDRNTLVNRKIQQTRQSVNESPNKQSVNLINNSTNECSQEPTATLSNAVELNACIDLWDCVYLSKNKQFLNTMTSELLGIPTTRYRCFR